jgi:hypothetical protein
LVAAGAVAAVLTVVACGPPPANPAGLGGSPTTTGRPVTTTAPPVTTPAPAVTTTTAPPVTTTAPAVTTTTAPPVTTTAPPVTTTAPPVTGDTAVITSQQALSSVQQDVHGTVTNLGATRATLEVVLTRDGTTVCNESQCRATAQDVEPGQTAIWRTHVFAEPDGRFPVSILRVDRTRAMKHPPIDVTVTYGGTRWDDTCLRNAPTCQQVFSALAVSNNGDRVYAQVEILKSDGRVASIPFSNVGSEGLQYTSLGATDGPVPVTEPLRTISTVRIWNPYQGSYE